MITRQRRRRITNAAMMALCALAAGIGLGGLALVLGQLVGVGIAGLNPAIVAEMTPPPGAAGGLANAIAGSFAMTAIAVLAGTPIGLLAATYMAEYERQSPLTALVRLVSDILLSAPSIIVGLFVYEVLVRPAGHFSALAGAAALAIIVIPVVLRTTEDMLRLVPDSLREAAASIGAPRVVIIRAIAWRAARAGMITGILLAIARIAGETAPLLFTALNNQFWSIDLNTPMASLPVTIFQFALSPYAEWQQLAWSGALIITAAVLALSVAARLSTRGGAPQ